MDKSEKKIWDVLHGLVESKRQEGAKTFYNPMKDSLKLKALDLAFPKSPAYPVIKGFENISLNPDSISEIVEKKTVNFSVDFNMLVTEGEISAIDNSNLEYKKSTYNGTVFKIIMKNGNTYSILPELLTLLA